MRLFRLVTLLATVLIPTFAAHGENGEISFRYAHQLIWIDLRVDGASPATPPLHFLLDTGAGVTVIDLNAAKHLGLQFGRSETIAGVDGRATAWHVSGFHTSVAGAPVRDSLLALDLSRVSRACGEHIDGLLGADFLRDKIVQIDYAAGRLRLFSSNGTVVAAAGAIVLPLRQTSDAWCIPIAISGNKPQWLRLDTGCDEALLWVIDRHTRLNSSSAATAATSVGFSAATPKYATLDVRLGSDSLTGIPAGLHEREIFPGESGLIGNPLLSRYKITIDARAKKLILERS